MQYTCSSSIRRRSCFSGSSQIALNDGSFKALSDITIGDQVLVNEHDVYEPVIAFIHAELEGLFGFLAVDVQSTVSNSSSTIFISSDHLMFDFDSGVARFAKSFHVGDRVQLVENAQIVPGEIIGIRLEKQKGFYAPLTPSGTIVVDRVLCSNYAIVENHDLAHKAMGIYRWWISLVGPSAPSNRIPWMLQIMYNLETILQLSGWEMILSSYI
jgi:desert hedgehog protein